MEYFKNFSFLWKGLQISLPTSPQPPQTLSLSQVMQEKMILVYYTQIRKFGPKLPKMEFFKIFSFLWKGFQISLLTSPQPSQTLSLSQVMQENVIMPKYGNSAPGSQKWNFSKKISFLWKGFQISLLTSPQPSQTLSLSKVMQENVIMPKYGNSAPGSQKWNFSKNFHFSEKVFKFRF